MSKMFMNVEEHSLLPLYIDLELFYNPLSPGVLVTVDQWDIT